jgi:hypothetical protein
MESLFLTEVLRRTGQQLDLQALWRGATSPDRVTTLQKVLCDASLDNRVSSFAGISWRIKPSDGLEPSTPS